MTIFCDASALIAIIAGEPDADQLADALERDAVRLCSALSVKGTSVTLKRGATIRNIHLTDDPEEIEGRVDKVKGLVLKTCFLKKA